MHKRHLTTVSVAIFCVIHLSSWQKSWIPTGQSDSDYSQTFTGKVLFTIFPLRELLTSAYLPTITFRRGPCIPRNSTYRHVQQLSDPPQAVRFKWIPINWSLWLRLTFELLSEFFHKNLSMLQRRQRYNKRSLRERYDCSQHFLTI